MSGDRIAALIGITASLFLATRAWSARSAGLSFENKAMMAVVWVLAFVVVAFVAGRFAR